MRRRDLLALAPLAVLGACSPRQPPTPAQRAITFMVAGDPAELRAYQALADAFHGLRPDLEVRLVSLPDQREFRRRLGADFAAGSPADLLLLNYRRYADLDARNLLEPLDSYLADSTLREADFYPEALAPFRRRGRLMAIPQNVSSLVVYYNRTLFRNAGLPEPADDWTWGDFLAAALRLTRGDGSAKQYGLGTEANLVRAAPFIWQNGGTLVDNPARPHILTITEAPAVQALRWFCELQTRHRVVPNAAEEKAEDSEARFLRGQTAMLLNSRRGVPGYRRISGLDWDVAPLPRGRKAAGVLHADAYFITSACLNKAAAWAFIEYANSDAGQHLMAGTGRTVPSRRSVADSTAFLDPDQRPHRSRAFLTTIPHLHAFPVHRRWVDVEEVVSDEIERAFYGRAELTDALVAATERTTELFAEP